METKDIIFCDTSAFARLFYRDEDKGFFQDFYESYNPKIYISELTKLEFISVVYKKQRQRIAKIKNEKMSRDKKRDLIEDEKINTQEVLSKFEETLKGITVVSINVVYLREAFAFMLKYNSENLSLYAPDAVQLATAIHHKNSCDAFSAVDQSLLDFFKLHNLPIF